MYFKHDYYEVYGWFTEDGVRKIGHIHVDGDGFNSNLENIVISSGAKPFPKARTAESIYAWHGDIEGMVDDTNSSRTVFVDNLGPNILGMYDTSNDTVYVLKGLDSHVTEWVKAHEYAHRRRAYMGQTQDEVLVDQEASEKMGYNPFPYRHSVNY